MAIDLVHSWNLSSWLKSKRFGANKRLVASVESFMIPWGSHDIRRWWRQWFQSIHYRVGGRWVLVTRQSRRSSSKRTSRPWVLHTSWVTRSIQRRQWWENQTTTDNGDRGRDRDACPGTIVSQTTPYDRPLLGLVPDSRWATCILEM